MKDYRWETLSQSRPKNVESLTKILLANRGLTTKKQTDEYFSPPNPLSISPESVGISPESLTKSLNRIAKALKNREKIIVYGDYDADGICSTAILWETLHQLGANALPYIPDRLTEGYGLNEDSIVKLKKDDPELKLIITVDHGIVGHKKIDFAKELGVDVIVTDHHQPLGAKPSAMAVVHTTSLSGSGVAWMLAKELQKTGSKLQITRLLELVALGTIADLIPLVGPNRALVMEGLKQIATTNRVGLLALMEVAKIDKTKIGTYEVGYMLTPRLNAMGRLEHAMESLRLLCTGDKDRALELVAKLDQTNRDRQQLTQETVLHARQFLLQKQNVRLTPLIFIAHESYQQGVIGLVAGKLVEEFYRPAIVISRGEVRSKASARSIPGFNIIDTIREATDLLVEAGGHPMAAGFTVETSKLEILEKRLTEIAEAKINGELASRQLKVDAEIDLSLVDQKLAQNLKRFEPFGQGNPEPVFISRDIKLKSFRQVGDQNQHLKLQLSVSGNGPRTVLDAIGFRMGEHYPNLSPDALVDIVYNITLEQWNGNERLQLRLKDIKVKPPPNQ